MNRIFKTIAAASFMLAPLAANAEPIKLKLSYFSSDRSMLYLAGVKPFVDAFNAEAKGLAEIEVFFSGALGKSPAQQPQLVRDGVAEMAYIIPGYTGDRFPDDAVVELPGLYRDQSEASLVYSRLVNKGALRGYEDFVVVSAFTAEPHSIHTRKPISSLADLKGRTVRANNPIEATTFEKLGMKARVMPVNAITDALSRGEIDGAAIPPAMLGEFGVSRLAAHHYIIFADAPALALVMSRKVFDALPEKAREIVRKYSGEWSVAQSNAFFADVNPKAMQALKDDPRRTVIFPSEADRRTIDTAFKAVIDEWAGKSERNKELLEMAQAEIAKIRAPVGMAPQ